MASVSINPQSIWLNTINSTNFTGIYDIRNESSYTSGGTLNNIGSGRITKHPNAMFNGQMASPVFLYSTVSNFGPGAHYPIGDATVAWFSNKGGLLASSSYYHNFNVSLSVPYADPNDWFVATTPDNIAPPTSIIVDYSTSTTVWTSSVSGFAFYHSVNSTNPLVALSADPYAIGTQYTVPGASYVIQLLIETTGIPNLIAYKYRFGIGGQPLSTFLNRIFFVDTSTNQVVYIKRETPVYQNTSFVRSEFDRWTKIK